MKEQEFEQLIEESLQRLDNKQQELSENYGFDSFENYELDFEKEQITFFAQGRAVVKAKITPIGSFNEANQSWLWGWGNEGFSASLKERAARLKALKKRTGFSLFTTPMAEADDEMAWHIAAVSLDFLELDGLYLIPEQDTSYFYALYQIEKV